MVATTEKRGTEFLQQHEQATHASAPRSGHESGHGILVRGVNLKGAAAPAPVLLKMHDDDFPARFFADLASQDASVYPPGSAVPPPISHAEVAPPDEPLYQPVQRMLNVAMVQLSCESVSFPRVDPTRIVSAGLVVRRCVRQPRNGSTPAWNDPNTLQAWMKNPAGQCAWVTLNSQQTEDLDPDPTLRPQLKSGHSATDAALATLKLSTALMESTTPAFAALPSTCARLRRTVVYGVIPTASSEMADADGAPAPTIQKADLLQSLPYFLTAPPQGVGFTVPLPNVAVDFHWLSDDFLTAVYPPSVNTDAAPTPNPKINPFQNFVTALRMLHSVFGAFESGGAPILAVLNRHNVSFHPSSGRAPQALGDFYRDAYNVLLAFTPSQPLAPTPPAAAPKLLMPSAWGWLTASDQNELLAAMQTALVPRAATVLAPQGRFHGIKHVYRVRLFIRLKGHSPKCPTELHWSDYSAPFRIAAWHETGDRVHMPVPLPDTSLEAFRKAKPNCSFAVPGSLMGAMQGSSLSGLIGGGGGGGGMKLGWICGFNIPLITICAFFVLNIFLTLLNIVFFWLPFIKICIPFPEEE